MLTHLHHNLSAKPLLRKHVYTSTKLLYALLCLNLWFEDTIPWSGVVDK